jgi:hypothetical protein
MELTMAREEPKVVNVHVEEASGWSTTSKATVTLDDGTSRDAYGYSEANAIEKAADKAQEASWWSWKLFG